MINTFMNNFIDRIRGPICLAIGSTKDGLKCGLPELPETRIPNGVFTEEQQLAAKDFTCDTINRLSSMLGCDE